VSTDREELIALLSTVDRFAGSAPVAASQALRRGADRARRHLLLAESPDGDCARRVGQAATAAYAAGEARGAGARPDRRHGHPGDGPAGTVTP
jgi:hypothetical protein